MIVVVALASVTVAATRGVTVSSSVSLGSFTVSPVIVTVIVAVVCPAMIVGAVCPAAKPRIAVRAV